MLKELAQKVQNMDLKPTRMGRSFSQFLEVLDIEEKTTTKEMVSFPDAQIMY